MEDNKELVLSSTNTNLLNLDYQSVRGLAREFFTSGVFADTVDESKAVIKILSGQELNLPPLYSMRNFYMIPISKKNPDGKTYRKEIQMSMSAQCMGLLLRRSKRIRWEVPVMTDIKCTLQFYEMIDEQWKKGVESTYTLDDAKRAGLVKDYGNWKTNPQAMLFARALSQGAKRVAPDLLGSAPYVPADFPEVTEVVDLSATKLLEEEPAPLPNVKKVKGKVTEVQTTKEATTVAQEFARQAAEKAGETVDKAVTEGVLVTKLDPATGEVVEEKAVAVEDKNKEVDSDGSGGDLFQEQEEHTEDSGDTTEQVDTGETEDTGYPPTPSDPDKIKSPTQLCQFAFNEMKYQPNEVKEILDVKSMMDIPKNYTMQEAYNKLWAYYCDNKGSG